MIELLVDVRSLQFTEDDINWPTGPQVTNTHFISGAISPSGSVTTELNANQITKDGAITPDGELIELSVGIETFGGELTPNGSLNLVQSGYQIVLGNSIFLEGILTFDVYGITVDGSITPNGAVSIPTLFTSQAGAITPVGAVNTVTGVFSGGGGGDVIRRKKKKFS